jgi:Xaa-Pro aminopeptidase
VTDMELFALNRRKLTENIKKEKIDAFLVTHPADLFYLTGLELDGYWLLVSGDGIKIAAPRMLRPQLRSSLKGLEPLGGRSALDALAACAAKTGIKRIGIDSGRVSVDLLDCLRKRIKKVSWIKMPDHVVKLRQVKSEGEIGRVRESCRLAVSVFSSLKGGIKPGITEKEIRNGILDRFLKEYADSSFSPIVASGVNSAFPHHLSSDRTVRKDDIVMVDLGCRLRGYCSDYTRTVFLGKRPGELGKIYGIVEEAQKKAIEGIRPGIPASKPDAIARGVIRRHGYGRYFSHSTGHGLGIEIHEMPNLSASCGTILEPGMVLTVEPGIYIREVGGIRIEDTVLVTEQGCEVLTN